MPLVRTLRPTSQVTIAASQGTPPPTSSSAILLFFPSSSLYFTQGLQSLRRPLLPLLDQPHHPFKPLTRCVSHNLIQHALTRTHHPTLGHHSAQRDRHLLLVTTTDAVRKHIDPMSGRQQVERGLQNADVRFDPDDDDGGGGREGRGDAGHIHAEEGFVVDGSVGLGVGQAELGAKRTEGGGFLRGGVDGDGEEFTFWKSDAVNPMR